MEQNTFPSLKYRDFLILVDYLNAPLNCKNFKIERKLDEIKTILYEIKVLYDVIFHSSLFSSKSIPQNDDVSDVAKITRNLFVEHCYNAFLKIEKILFSSRYDLNYNNELFEFLRELHKKKFYFKKVLQNCRRNSFL